MKVEKVTPDKPEIDAIASRLGIDPDAVFGKCFRIWRWFDDHTTDGWTSGVSKASVDRRAGHQGFADAMIEVGWLVEGGDGLELPNFERHNGVTAKTRADAAIRQSKSRASRASQDRVTIPRPMRKQIYDRDNHQCVYCGFIAGTKAPTGEYVGARISLDHVIPCCDGGDTTPENMVTCCSVCNNRKNGRSPQHAGMVARYVTEACDAAVTKALPREEKRREESSPSSPPPPASQGGDSPSSQAWKGVEEDLRNAGVRLWREAAASARSNGCTTDAVVNVIGYWRLNTGAWDAGALFQRVSNMLPGEDCSDLWPEKSPKFEAAKRREESSKSQVAASSKRKADEVRKSADEQLMANLEAEFGQKIDVMSDDDVRRAILAAEPGAAGSFMLSRYRGGRPTGTTREAILTHFSKTREAVDLLSEAR